MIEPLDSGGYEARLSAAVEAVEGAGQALLAVRGRPGTVGTIGDQLKTAFDEAAEGWVLGYLRGLFSDDRFMAEEAYEPGQFELSKGSAYWTIDALDGTRSFVEGFAGFCVQVAYVDQGQPRIGVIYEPVSGTLYSAVAGQGAHRRNPDGTFAPLRREKQGRSSTVRWIDSTLPEGETERRLFKKYNPQFVECGSVGLKLCRIAEDTADLLVKRFRFKMWDVAPGHVLLKEAGVYIGVWDGDEIDYTNGRDRGCRGLVVAPPKLFDSVSGELRELKGEGDHKGRWRRV